MKTLAFPLVIAMLSASTGVAGDSVVTNHTSNMNAFSKLPEWSCAEGQSCRVVAVSVRFAGEVRGGRVNCFTRAAGVPNWIVAGGEPPMNMSTSNRQIGSVTIVDIRGRIVLGEECISLSKLVSELLNRGQNRILLNLADVSCIDSAGFAYLIGSLASVRKRSGDLKLLNPPDNIRAVMQLSKLLTVFDVGEDEASAVKSFAN